jgi:hypothetical protein
MKWRLSCGDLDQEPALRAAAQGPHAPESGTPPVAASVSSAAPGETIEAPWLTAEAFMPSVAEPIAEPPASRHRCPFCGGRHQGIPLGGGGLADAYSRPIGAASWETGSRPRPIGLTASEQAAEIRDGFRAWHTRSTGTPPTPEPRSVRDRVRSLWYGDSID